MPIIHAQTARGLRLLPALTAGQALALVLTGLGVWGVVSRSWPGAVRAVAALILGLGGAAYAIGRWPFGARGERLAAWMPRIGQYLLSPRLRTGARLLGWDGIRGIRPSGLLLTVQGTAVVLECCGGTLALRDHQALAAARVVYRELLHALSAPAAVVGLARHAAAGDRPALWDPSACPPGLEAIGAAYAAHWSALVAAERLLVRRSVLVLCGGRDAGDLGATAAAAVACAARMGLTLKPLDGAALACLLREAEGASRPAAPAAVPGWEVRGHHA